MNAHASAHLLGMFLALGAAPMASAMDLSQSPAPASQAQSGFALPMFLDGARLSVLKEAWEAHFSGISIGNTTATGGEDAEAAAIENARRTLTRAEEIDREAAAVRERAEELSRRFAAEQAEAAAPIDAAAASASISTSAADGETVPAETASIDDGSTDREAPVAQLVPVSASDEAIVQPAAVAAPAAVATRNSNDDAPVIEDMATKPVRLAKRVSGTSSRASVQTTASAAPLVTGLMVVDPTAPKPQTSIMMPTELRAFGWSSQP